VVEGKDITPEKVRALADAADRCWHAILSRDLDVFARAFADSFAAQIAMFPAMLQPGIQEYIDIYSHEALAWKLSGAGGGGYLALVVPHAGQFPTGALPITIRRKGLQ
jgi:galactokinase/mevalonate kinase-like predicted kinase